MLREYAESKSEAAFAEFVRRHLSLVYHSAFRRTGGRADLAQDIAQGVFTKVARDALSLSRRPALAGWLYHAARFAAHDALRSERRRLQREHEAHLLDFDPANAPPPDWEHAGAALDELLNRLSPTDREIILLRFFEQQSFPHIGQRLRLSEEAARKRATRSLDKLRAWMARRGIDSSVAALAALLSTHAAQAIPPSVEPAVVRIAMSAAANAARSVVPTSRAFDVAHILGGLAGVVALLVVGVAVHEVQGLRRSEAELAQVTANHRAMAKRLDALEPSARARDTPQAKGPAESVLSSTAISDAAASSPAIRGGAFSKTHPEDNRLVQLQARNHFAWWNEPRGRAIGLTPAQIEKLGELQTLQRGQVLTFTTEFGTFQLNQSFGDLSAAEAKEKARAIMGEEAYARAVEFDRAGGARALAGEAAAVLNFTETPMTSAQANALVQIVARASPEFVEGKSVDRNHLDWDAILRSAASALSAPQLKIIEALKLRQAAEIKLAQHEKPHLSPPSSAVIP